jgi:hypothetical protein
MITVYGTVDSYEVAESKEGEAGPGLATITVTAEEPSSGTMTLKVPQAATGGTALGRCRIILDQA